MSGNTNFPTGLDDDASLVDVVDSVTAIVAAHHNNLKEGMKAIEAKMGIYSTAAPTSMDYRLGNPTGAHSHDGASGQAGRLNPTTIVAPSGAVGTPSTLHDHLLSSAIHNPTTLAATGIATAIGNNVISVPTQLQKHIINTHLNGTAIVGSNVIAPVVIGRTMQLESVQAALRVAPAGTTTSFIVRIGPTHIYGASVGNGLIFLAGATGYRSTATPNLITYPSGAMITLDVDAVGNTEPGRDLGITFIFRE